MTTKRQDTLESFLSESTNKFPYFPADKQKAIISAFADQGKQENDKTVKKVWIATSSQLKSITRKTEVQNA